MQTAVRNGVLGHTGLLAYGTFIYQERELYVNVVDNHAKLEVGGKKR